MPRLRSMAVRWLRCITPAFSTTVCTVTSGLHACRIRAMVGKMKKLRELGPHMPIFPSPFPVPHRSWHGKPPTMSRRLPMGSPCAKFRRIEALLLRRSQTSPASL
eukprot:6644583-Heterocapsa_arctica.AAC.1